MAAGCHGGIVTKMASSGFQAPSSELGLSVPFCTRVCGSIVGGSLGANVPSSRSLSYKTMVPSACATRNKLGEEGTQRTAEHGELDMRPCGPKG